MRIIETSGPLRGSVRVPGDKSISHRSVMIGSIAEGDSYIRGFLKSADCLATIDCFRKMGISIETAAGGVGRFPDASPDEEILIVHGKGLKGLSAPDGVILNAANSGTTVRLLSGILSGQNFRSEITGDESLSKRPMARIMRPLSEMGITITALGEKGRLPLIIEGGKPQAIRYTSPIASAQVKSCVLFASLYADGPCFYTEPCLSRNHTELMLSAFGGNLKVKNREDGSVTTILYPGTILTAKDITVPGDISSAAYFLAAGLIIPDSEITCRNVGINETRDGILRVIRAMGGTMEISNVHMEGCEPVADIKVRTSSLRGTTIGGNLIPTLIDEIPVIAVMAACASGVTVIRDAAELKVKESNRLHEIVKNLQLMGIAAEETEDGMRITGGHLRSARIDPVGDHRLAMAFSIAGLAASGQTAITDETCVNISYPEFYQDLTSLG